MNRFLNEYIWLAMVLLLAFVGLSTLLLVGWVLVGSWIQERGADLLAAAQSGYRAVGERWKREAVE